ncbi:hypothetical protein CPB84DRAFT_1840935 [Gymnopilus junonius]|uniref:C2H2-type domain-containing protein n=1 Tax=Gymnopilus junonius TaxID=109634 RepID=A0A9P5P3L8_GYMJU|nr:hypothetical protein CPB84DRAFT_1840935 [Gymnopilus junonius]
MKAETKSKSLMWKCDECPKSFGRNGDLTRHKNLHKGYKPHKCKNCGKVFSQNSGLKTHENVHSKAKPYACGFDGCDASFGDPSSCARHRKETHRRVGVIVAHILVRRSAFTAHLRRHRIDPITIDVDSLAPPLLPASVPVPCRSSIQQLVPCDIKPRIERIGNPPKPRLIEEYEKELFYYYVPHFYPPGFEPDELASLSSSYSVHSEAYTVSYPNSVPSSVVVSTSHHTTLSSNLDSCPVESLQWEVPADKLYLLDSPSSPSNINMHGSPSASPPSNLFATTEAEPPLETPCNVDSEQDGPFYDFNYALPPLSHYLLPDYLQSRRAVDFFPLLDPTPEASWVFA